MTLATTKSHKNHAELPFTLTVKQIAELLNISLPVAYELTKRADFPAVRVGKKRIMIPRDRLLRWLNENADKPIV